MRSLIIVIIICISSLPFSLQAQQPDSLIHKLDSLHIKADSGKQVNNINPAAYNQETKLTVKSYFILLGSDFKQAFTKPFHLKHKDIAPLAIFAGTAIAVGLADEPIQRAALKWRNNNPSVAKVGNFVSRFGGMYETYALVGFGLYGVIFKSQKMKTTTLLASQAYILGGAEEAVLKTLSGRTRPNFYSSTGEAEPKFLGPFGNTSRDALRNKSNSSFPSGHTTVAFAAATVFAMEYKEHWYIPVISYTAATLIGMSRITENKHWSTDVLVGAALGWVTGRQVVNNYHRYAKIKAPEQKKNNVTWHLNYEQRHLGAGLVYHVG
ncbi:MAG: phosphatase PAP2 family protein [Ferruginibacter sp.]